jgi:hypothetical protein
LLDDTEVQHYQSLIDAMQFAISIGWFDIITAVMTLSRFRAMPRQGHMDNVKRIYGYLSQMKDAVICLRVDEPDLLVLPEQDFDWSNTVYGDVKEMVPDENPDPLGNCVTLIQYYDANLYQDLTTGHSVTGILHLFKKNPEWYSKKQATVVIYLE